MRFNLVRLVKRRGFSQRDKGFDSAQLGTLTALAHPQQQKHMRTIQEVIQRVITILKSSAMYQKMPSPAVLVIE